MLRGPLTAVIVHLPSHCGSNFLAVGIDNHTRFQQVWLEGDVDMSQCQRNEIVEKELI